jgi:hypothetical protein
MSRGAHRFKQSDVVKALKAATIAGLKVRRTLIDPNGNIVVEFGDPEKGGPSLAQYDWADVR